MDFDILEVLYKGRQVDLQFKCNKREIDLKVIPGGPNTGDSVSGIVPVS